MPTSYVNQPSEGNLSCYTARGSATIIYDEDNNLVATFDGTSIVENGFNILSGTFDGLSTRFYGEINNTPSAGMTSNINSGTFYGVVNIDGTQLNSTANINDGTFHGVVNLEIANIEGGIFNNIVYVTTSAQISSGIYNSDIIGDLEDVAFFIIDSLTEYPVINGNVINGSLGIYALGFNSTNVFIGDNGEFSGTVYVEEGQIVYGTFYGIVYNGAVIGTSAFARISGGAFSNLVYNKVNSTIEGGIFGNTVENLGKIYGGEFYADITGDTTGYIHYDPLHYTPPVFGGSVSDNNLIIDNGDFDSSVTFVGMGGFIGYFVVQSVAKIIGGYYLGDFTVQSNGRITNGSFDGGTGTNNGTIEDGEFFVAINNEATGSLTGGEYYGAITNNGSINGITIGILYGMVGSLSGTSLAEYVIFKPAGTIGNWTYPTNTGLITTAEIHWLQADNDLGGTIENEWYLGYDGIPTNYVWTGLVDGDLNKRANYSPVGLPRSIDFVTVDETCTNQPSSGSVTCDIMYVNNNGTILAVVDVILGVGCSVVANNVVFDCVNNSFVSINNASLTTATFNGYSRNNFDGIVTTGTFNGSSRNFGTVITGTFNGSSYNGGFVTTATFNDSSNNTFGTVTTGTFNGTSFNNVGTVTTGTFNDSSYNNDSVTYGTFNYGTVNYGTVITGTFNDISYNGGTVTTGTFNDGSVNYQGTVPTGTFNDSSYNAGEVTTGTFNGGSYNDGIVTTGTFNGTSYNNWTVTYAYFYNLAENKLGGTCDKATFYRTFDVDLQQWNYPVNSGTITNAYVYWLIGDGALGGTYTTIDYRGYPVSANSINYIFGGATSGSLSNSTNYYPNRVPTAIDDVTVDEFSVNQPSSGSVTCDIMYVNNNGTVPAVVDVILGAGCSVVANNVVFDCVNNSFISTNNASLTTATFNGYSMNNFVGIVTTGTFNGSSRNLGTVITGTFNGSSYNGGFVTTCTFNDSSNNTFGTVTTGTFNGTSFNNIGTVTTGTFNNLSTNFGTVTDGTFNDSSYNHNIGEVTTGTFYDNSVNGGTVTAGTFNGSSVNNGNGFATVTDGTFNESSGNYATVTTGTFNWGSVNYGSVTTGTFNDTAVNDGTVTTGIFNGGMNADTVTTGTFNGSSFNMATVTTGTFNEGSANYGSVTTGTFNDSSYNAGGTVTDGTFNDSSYNRGLSIAGTFNDSSYNHSNGSVTTGTFYPTPDGFGGWTYTVNNGTVGTANIYWIQVDNDLGGTITTENYLGYPV